MDRKLRVMIACVTFETVRVTDAVRYYGANRVYLLHHVSRRNESSVYREFYERVCAILSEEEPGTEIIDVDRSVGDFEEMLRVVTTIIREEGASGAEIYVNLSAGTPEYIVAAATASMMSPGVIPFFSKSKEYTVSREKVREVFYEDGLPVGMTRSVREQVGMPSFTIEMPDEKLVRALRIWDSINEAEGRAPSSTVMVQRMREAGCWSRRGRSTARSNDSVYYQRMYVDRWLGNGWVERPRGPRSGYVVTGKGRLVLDSMWADGGLRPADVGAEAFVASGEVGGRLLGCGQLFGQGGGPAPELGVLVPRHLEAGGQPAVGLGEHGEPLFQLADASLECDVLFGEDAGGVGVVCAAPRLGQSEGALQLADPSLEVSDLPVGECEGVTEGLRPPIVIPGAGLPQPPLHPPVFRFGDLHGLCDRRLLGLRRLRVGLPKLGEVDPLGVQQRGQPVSLGGSRLASSGQDGQGGLPLPEFGAEVPERYVQHPGLVGVRALLDGLLGGRDLRAYRFDIPPRLADVPGLGRFHAHGDGLGQI